MDNFFPDDEKPSPIREVLEGVGIVLLMLFALFLTAYAAFDTWAEWGPNGPVDDWANIPMLLLSFCGLTQLVYVVPAYFFFKRNHFFNNAKGVMIGAILVFVSNLGIYLWWMYR
jgi:hypothetical protein